MNTPSTTFYAYKDSWSHLERLHKKLKKAAGPKKELAPNLTAVFAKILAKAPEIDQLDFDKFCEKKSQGLTALQRNCHAKSFILPQHVKSKVPELQRKLVQDKNNKLYNITSYIIENTIINEENYF